ncbi:MAG TPA: hypothetical protein VGG97_15135 [Bryobacteraceae bacterium]|jgi:hypothetical protein
MNLFLSEMLGLFQQVPGTFWGVVFGSIFTLLGTHLTNRSNDRRLGLQFKKETAVKKYEREMIFRKETYAAAVEAISTGFYALPRFADLAIPDNQITANYLEHAPLVAKAHLIANEKTLKALTDITTELGAAFLRLSIQRIPLMALQQEIKLTKDRMDKHHQAIDAVLELMKRQNIDGIQDERRMKTLKGNFDFEAQHRDDALATFTRLNKESADRHIALLKDCCTESMRISPLLPIALVAAREELEHSINIENYAEIIKQSQTNTQAQIEKFFNDLELMVKKAATEESNSRMVHDGNV